MVRRKLFKYHTPLFHQSLLQLFFITLICTITGCSQSNDKLFTKVLTSRSNINFKNILVEDGEFNVFSYPYFYNGAGVAVGDINNDGLTDIFYRQYG